MYLIGTLEVNQREIKNGSYICGVRRKLKIINYQIEVLLSDFKF